MVVGVGFCSLSILFSSHLSVVYGQDRATLVQRALFAEAMGRAAERADLGGRAADLAKDDDIELQWLAGRVRYEDQWRTPEEVAEFARDDARLRGFEKLRASQPNNLQAWITMGRYCTNQKLNDQARVYWSQVLSLTPEPEAKRALKLERYRDGYSREEHIKLIEAEQAAAKERYAHWQTTVAGWLEAETLEEVRKSAAEKFRDLPGDQVGVAAQMITSVPPKPKTQTKSARADLEPLRDVSLELVAALAKRREGRATDALVHLAVTTRWPEVRDAAALALRGRPQNAFVPQLIGSMISPIESKFSVYASPEGDARTFHTLTREGPGQNQALTRQTNIRPTPDGSVAGLANGASLIRGAQQNAAQVNEQVKRANAEAAVRNAWIRAALMASTGEKLGDEPRFWWKWWMDANELYQEEPRTQERTIQVSYEYTYYTNSYRPNPETGEWAYKPVLGTTVRPATPLVRISVGSDGILTTRGHPFWVAREGWQMAKQLKEGALLHGWGGSQEIEAIVDQEAAPAFNLVVADFHTYCVGRGRILAHDNSMCAPTYWPLPGLSQSDFDRLSGAKP